MKNINKENWEKFTSSLNNCHLLQLYDWGLLKEQFGWKVDYFIDQSTGAQVLFKPLFFGYSIAYIPKGPLGGTSSEFWKKLGDFCKTKKSILIRVEPDDGFDQFQLQILNQLSRPGKAIQPKNTIIVDISKSPEEILSGMKQKTRYNVRLAQKKDIKIESSDDINVFHQLMLQTGDRDQFGIHTFDYYKKAYDFFKKDDKVMLLIAHYQGKPLAGLMMFFNGNRAWYFYGASSNEERNRMPTYLLQYEAMIKAKEKGCLTYDLWGIPDESEEELERNFGNRSDGLWGVYRFKRGFGGFHKQSLETRDIILNPIFYWIFRRIENYRSGL